MKIKNILIIIAILAIALLLIWKFYSPTPEPILDQNTSTTNISDYAGVISTSTNGKLLYTNNKVGLKFTFPQGWHLGSNTLGYGSLQLFNYDETKASGKSVFPKGQNKIEAVIGNSNSSAPSSDYPEKSRKSTSIQIAGQTAIREDIELVGGQQFRTYFISLPNQSENFLSITIFGDPTNFGVLDYLIESIEWSE